MTGAYPRRLSGLSLKRTGGGEAAAEANRAAAGRSGIRKGCQRDAKGMPKGSQRDAEGRRRRARRTEV